MPILKGRLGEFNALRQVDPTAAARFTPLIEFVPQGDELDENGDPIQGQVAETVMRTADRLARCWPGQIEDEEGNPRERCDVIVDLHGLPAIDGYHPIGAVIDRFFDSDLTQVIPACRFLDAVDDGLMERLNGALDRFRTRDVCIRISGEDLDERDEPIATSIERLLLRLRTTPENTDLIIDFGSINETSASFAARIARLIIIDLPYLSDWKSLTLTAGGFPNALDDVSPQTLTELPRWELTTWRTVNERVRDRLRLPSFGDYAVAYPMQTAGVPFAPAPQIRYTASEGWLILKGRRNDRRGNAQFFEIARTISQHPEFTPGLSWGDERIAEMALYAGIDPPPEDARPGNATTWRSIGTSHHIAHVMNRLSTAGEP